VDSLDYQISNGYWRFVAFWGADDPSRPFPPDSILDVRELSTNRLVVSLYPDSAESWSDLAGSYRSVGNYEQAHQANDRAIALQPGTLKYRLALATTLEHFGLDAQAMQYFDSLLSNPAWNVAATYWRKANLARRGGQLSQAAADYRSALLADRETEVGVLYPVIYGDTAVAIIRRVYGKGEAMRVLAAAIERGPTGTLYELLGDAYAQDSLYDQALAQYRQMAALRSGSGHAALKVGNTLFELERFEEALRAYADAWQKDSTLTSALFNMGAAHANLSRDKEAGRWYAEYVVRMPEDPDGWLRLGYITSLDLKSDREAVGYFERALLLDPAVFDARPSLRGIWEDALSKVGKQPPATVAQVETRYLGRKSKPTDGGSRASPTAPRPNATRAAAPRGPREVVSTGSGIVVGDVGRVLTNAHVVDECAEVQVTGTDGRKIPSRVAGVDVANDLALIRAPGLKASTLSFQSEPPRPGQTVVALGFPLTGLLSPQVVNATGSISATAGLNNDDRMLQISAPVQAGNSGGPVLDLSGAIVGVVVSKLDAARVYEITGDLPQNVNFAIKGRLARDFLEANGVSPVLLAGGADHSVPDVVESGKWGTVLIECLR